MEQTSSAAYPNILVVDYVKKARVASPQILMKAENFLNVGYQKLLTFERPGGGFDWWGSGPPLVWLSAYGLQEFSDMARVYPIDRGVIERTQRWLLQQQDPQEGTWGNIGATHGETIARMGSPKLLLTSYVAWALLDSGLRVKGLDKAMAYIGRHVMQTENGYILALAANALAAWDPQDDRTIEVLGKLAKMQTAVPEWKASCFKTDGQSLSYARGNGLTVETTALTVLAMHKAGRHTTLINKALTFLVKSKQSNGTWGSTSATILSLKALLAGMGGTSIEKAVTFAIKVNGEEVAKGEVTPENSEVLQVFDLKSSTQAGRNDVEVQVDGETSMMYQIVGRHYEPRDRAPEPEKPVLNIAVAYGRTELTTSDLLKAKATLRYDGDVATYMVIVDLGIPPGFTCDPGEFAEMVGDKQIQKFSVTSRQITLYLGDVVPGDVKTFDYTLKPKFPVKAKTPATVAYEYYTPANRAESKTVALEVKEGK